MRKSLLSICAAIVLPFTVSAVLPTVTTPTLTGQGCTGQTLTLTLPSTPRKVVWNKNSSPVDSTINTYGANATTVAGGNGQGSAFNQLDNASGRVAFDASGRMYVADYNNHRIQRWSSVDTVTVAGGNGAGSAANQLDLPLGLTIDASDNLYVCDHTNSRIQKFASGSSIGVTVAGGNGQGSNPDQLFSPTDIFVGLNDTLYICDRNNHRVQQWAPGAITGTTVAGGNGQGGSLNQLDYPSAISVDNAGNIYICDTYNQRIVKWARGATSGVVVAGGNGLGSNPDQLYYPSDFALNSEGAIYILDGNNARVQKWVEGQISATSIWSGGIGGNADQVNGPNGLYINLPEEELYITDLYNHRIQKLVLSISTSANYVTNTAGNYTADVTLLDNTTGTSNSIIVSDSTIAMIAGNNAICVGASTTLTASGGNSYAWSESGVDNTIGGQTNATSITVSPTVNTVYYVSVSTSCNTVVDSITIIVSPIPTAILTGNDCGGQLSFNTNTTPESIVWQFNGAPIDTIYTKYDNNAVTIAGVVSETGADATHFYNSIDVALDAQGNMYVCDRINNRVQKFAPGSMNGVTVAGTGVSGNAASELNQPHGIFVDASGNLYIADKGNDRIQKWAPGAAQGVTLVGSNGAGSGADQLNAPVDIYVDPNGNLYAADFYNNRVQKFAPGSSIGVTVAGGNGYGNATNQLTYPSGIFVDANENVYVSDYDNHRVQKWAKDSLSGVTVAGGNGGGAGSNQLYYPYGVILDANNNLYIADASNNRIQKWSPGAIHGVTIVGDSSGNSGVDADRLLNPLNIAVDKQGNLYVADNDNHRIQKFNLITNTTFAYTAAASGNYTVALNAYSGCNTASNVQTINLFIVPTPAITGNTEVCIGSTTTLTASGGASYAWSEDGTDNTLSGQTAIAAVSVSPSVNTVYTVTVTSADACTNTTSILIRVNIVPTPTLTSVNGNCTDSLLVINTNVNASSIVWSKDGTPVDTTYTKYIQDAVTVAGTTGVYGSAATELAYPYNVIVDADNNIYVADADNYRVQKFTPGNPVGVTVVNSPNPFSNMALDVNGYIYIAENGNNQIVKYTAGNPVGVIVAGGNGVGSASNQFNTPQGLAVNAAGDIYVADYYNNRVQKWVVGADSGITVAGTGVQGSAADQFFNPYAIALDKAGNLYVSDLNNYRVQKFALDSSNGITIVPNDGNHGRLFGIYVDLNNAVYTADFDYNQIRRYRPDSVGGVIIAGENGYGNAADQLYAPYGVSIDKNGLLYVADAYNSRIQQFTPDTLNRYVAKSPGSYTAQVNSFAGCSGTSQALAVSDFPSTQIIGNTTICAGSSATLSSFATGTFTWTESGVDNTLGGQSTATITVSPTVTTTYNATISNSCSTVTAEVVVFVNPTPATTFVADNCGGQLSINTTATPENVVWKIDGIATDTIYTQYEHEGVIIAGNNGYGSSANQFGSLSTGIATDQQGNIYVADRDFERIQKWVPGASNGVTVAGGNGSGASDNQLYNPVDISLDNTGNVYVANYNSQRITKWAPGAIAGSTVLNLSFPPYSMCVDVEGNIYVSDYYGSVFKWLPNADPNDAGVQIIGANGQGDAADQLNAANDMAIDASGNLYIVDLSNYRVQKWTKGATSGVTIAGGNGNGNDENQLYSPYSIALDGANNVYVSEFSNSRIRKFIPGTNKTVYISTYNDNQIGNMPGITVDSKGNVTAMDTYNYALKQFKPLKDSVYKRIATVPGNYSIEVTSFSGCKYISQTEAIAPIANPTVTLGGNAYSCDGGNVTLTASGADTYAWSETGVGNTLSGQNTSASITVSPLVNTVYTVTATGVNGCAIVLSRDVNVYPTPTLVNLNANGGCTNDTLTLTSDLAADHIIWRANGVALDTTYYSTLGVAATVAGGNGSGSNADQIAEVYASAVDSAGNVYVADFYNYRIQKWAPGDVTGTTVAGGNGYGSAPNQLTYPRGIAIDKAGNLYITDSDNARVQKWAPGANKGVTVAGGNGYGSDPNQLANPQQLTLDKAGNIYIVDFSNSRVQMWAPGATQGITVAGGNGYGSDPNQLANAEAIAIDQDNNLYIADHYNHRVQKWVPGATAGITVAGGNGDGTDAQHLSYPTGVALDRFGNLYVANSGNYYGITKWAPGATKGILVAGRFDNYTGVLPGLLNYPHGLQFDKDDNLYVADTYYNRVQKYPLSSPFPYTYATKKEGVYTAELVTIAGCSATSQPIDINNLPNTTISGKNVLCAGESTTLTAASNGTYIWTESGSDNTLSGQTTAASVIVNPSVTTTYTVAITNTCGNNTATTVVTITPLPTATFTNSSCGSIDVTTNTALDHIAWSKDGSFIETIYNGYDHDGTTVAGGTQGSDQFSLNYPGAVAVDDEGNAFIVDQANHRVQKWAPGAASAVTVAGGNGQGSNANQLNTPVDIVLDKKGNLYIADFYNYRIQKWAPNAIEGITVAGGNGYGSNPNQLTYAGALYVDSAENLYVTDGDNYRVQKFVPGSNIGITVAGGNGYGSGSNQLGNSLYGLTMDKSGNLLINDANNSRIQKWAPGATEGTSFIENTAANYGLALDANNSLYAVETNYHRIVKYPQGSTNPIIIAGVDGYGSGASQFIYPTDVFTNAKGDVYVADPQNSRIQRFSPLNNVTYPYTANGSGTYVAEFTTPVGCSGSQSIIISDVPNASITINTTDTICEGSGLTLTANGGDTYLWDDFSTDNVRTMIPSSGTQTYSVTVTSANGCSATAAKTVVVLPSVQGYVYSNYGACNGGKETLYANIYSGSGNYSYLWSNGATTVNIYDFAGEYTVTVTDDDVTCGFITVLSGTIYQYDPIVATLSTSDATCSSALLTVNVTGGSGNFNYIWSNGETTTSPSITAVVGNTYSVIIADQDTDDGCMILSDTITVTSSGAIAALITPNGSTDVCDGTSVNLTASGGGINAAYHWSTGDSIPTITANSSGTYIVTITDAGCVATTEIVINVIPSPTVIISPNGATTFCDGNSLVLSASGATSYSWSTGENSDSITVSTSGIYIVTGTSANGCIDVNSIVVVVNPLATAQIQSNGPTTFSTGGSVQLTASGGTSYSWSNGATTDTTTITTSGNYTVTVSNNCSSATASQEIVVLGDTVIASITTDGPTTFCQGDSITLTAFGSVNYEWSDGGQTTKSIIVTAAGTYTVTVNDGQGLSDVASVVVTVNAKPIANITADGSTEICSGETVTLTADAADAYLWSTGETTQSVIAGNSATYSVTVSNTFGCFAVASTQVNVNAPPIGNIGSDGDIMFCVGGSVTLTADSSGSYLWNTSETTQSITVSTSGTYVVTITNAVGCHATSALEVIVDTNVTASITPNGSTTFCEGGNVVLMANAGDSYLWSTGETTQNITASSSNTYTVTVSHTFGCSPSAFIEVIVDSVPDKPTITVNGNILTSSNADAYQWYHNGGAINGATDATVTATLAGQYTVIVSNTAGCTAISDTVLVSIIPVVASITADGPTTFCQGGSVNLTASGGSNYQWSNGDTTATTHITTGGQYTVTVSNNQGSSDMDTVFVTVNPLPSIDIIANGPTIFCEGGSVTLTATSANSYLWSNGDTTQSITVNSSSMYGVLVSNTEGCFNTDSMSVTVNTPPAKPVITKNGSTLISTNAFKYQWTKNGSIIAGATNVIYQATAAGTYTVIITDANGCTNESDPVVHTGVGIANVSGTNQTDLSIYPNPFVDAFTIAYSLNYAEDVTITILDITGKTIATPQSKQWTSKGEHKLVVNTQDLSLKQGVYLVKITAGSSSLVRKVNMIVE